MNNFHKTMVNTLLKTSGKILGLLLLNSLLSAPSWSESSFFPNFFSNTDEGYYSVTITEAFVDMRSGPGRGYPIFYIAERGEEISILKSRTDWYRVENSKGVSGWVHATQIANTLDRSGNPPDISLPTIESYGQRSAELGILIGSFGSNDAINVYGSYHFNKNLSTEISYLETFGNASDGRGVFINLVHQPFPTWRISPYIALGGGIYETSPKSNLAATESRRDNVSLVAAGFRTYLGQRLFLQLQYNNYLVISDRDDDEEIESWTIGISTFF